MSEAGMSPGTPPQPAPRRVIRLLVETGGVQALATAAVLTIPALAPVIAPALGVATGLVGVQIAILYLVAMSASLVAGLVIARCGPCRTGQIAMALNAAGCLIASMPHLATIALGSIVIGCGYGLTNPAAAEMLVRHGPAARRNLIFSLKQTGVPVGGMMAGLAAPGIAVAYGWQAALWAIAGASLTAAAAAQVGRAELDRRREGASGAPRLPLRAFASVVRIPALRRLALSSMCFAGFQLSFVAFLVVLLVEDLRYDLVTAGAILGLVQIAGALMRVVWGHLADLLRDGLAVLIGLGALMAACAAVVALGAGLPSWVLLAMFVVLGSSAVGWTGVYMSEVARLAAPGSVGATTGATMFFTFTGVLLGPPAFAFTRSLLGSYVASYALLVGVALMSIGLLVAVKRG